MAGKLITVPVDYNVNDNTCGYMSPAGGRDYVGMDITTTQVKTALQENTTAIAALCSSPKINKWAAFRPGYWTASGSPYDTYNFNIPNNGFRLGDFIGYNPNAKPPVYIIGDREVSTVIEGMSDGQISTSITLGRGEADPIPKQMGANASKDRIDAQVWKDGSLIAHKRFSAGELNGQSVDIPITVGYGSGQVIIKPMYYAEEAQGEYTDIGLIEDGIKTLNYLFESWSGGFTASWFGVSNITGGNDISKLITARVTRTKSTVQIFCRLKISYTGGSVTIQYTDDPIPNIGLNSDPRQLTFEQNVIQGVGFNIILSSNDGITSTIKCEVQVSDNTIDMSLDESWTTIGEKTFTWTNPQNV